MIKRIVAILLTVMMLSSVCIAVPTFAASGRNINLLIDLGILKEVEQSRLIAKGYTRSDFAKALALLDSYPADELVDEEDTTKYASDIAEDENAGAICEVLARGLMETKDGKFRPAAPVSQADTITALVKILGYGPLAERNGTGQSGYYKTANKLGILKGVRIQNTNALSYTEVGGLLYNAMGVPYYSGSPNVDLNDECFFDLWGITQYTGKILANHNLGLYTSKTSHNNVNIGGKIYATNIIIEDVLVGSEVEYFTRLINGDETIVSLREIRKGADLVEVNANDIKNVVKISGGYQITYGNNKKITVAQSAFMLVNNKAMSPTLELFKVFESGVVTFIDSDGDRRYDVGHMTLLKWGIIEGISGYSESLVVNFGDKGGADIFLDSSSC